MKNRIVLFLGAATILGMASCSNNSGEGSYTQEQLDSIANYRADSIAMANKMANDSIIAAKADSVRIADSLAAAANKGTSSSSSHTSSTTKPETENPEVVPEEEKPTPRTQADIEADKKAARFGDKAAAERLKQDDAVKKAARFGDTQAKETVEQQEAQKKAARFNR